MAGGVLSAWRMSNLSRANDNLPAPETPVTRTKLSSKALPFSTKLSSKALPFQPAIGYASVPPSSQLHSEAQQHVYASVPKTCFPVPDVAVSKAPAQQPDNEKQLLETAKDFEENNCDIEPTPSLRDTSDSGSAVQSSEDQSDITAPPNHDDEQPLLLPKCHQEPSQDPEGSRRGAMTVKNTFIHYSFFDELVRSSSAPGLLTSQEVHSKYPEMEPSHIRGECSPCYYFARKQDGCRWGGECKYCHLCPPGTLQRKKKQRRKVADPEEQRRQLPSPEIISC